MEMDNYTYTHYDDLPILMTVEETSTLLRISRSETYKLCHKPGFPVTHVTDKRIMIPKEELFAWLADQRLPLTL